MKIEQIYLNALVANTKVIYLQKLSRYDFPKTHINYLENYLQLALLDTRMMMQSSSLEDMKKLFHMNFICEYNKTDFDYNHWSTYKELFAETFDYEIKERDINTIINQELRKLPSLDDMLLKVENMKTSCNTVNNHLNKSYMHSQIER